MRHFIVRTLDIDEVHYCGYETMVDGRPVRCLKPATVLMTTDAWMWLTRVGLRLPEKVYGPRVCSQHTTHLMMLYKRRQEQDD